MQFNSYLFILCFLPVTLIGFFLLNRAAFKRGRTFLAANLWLLAMSLCFYAYFNVSYLILILSSIGVNFCLGKLLNGDWKKETAHHRGLLTLGILFNTGLIFYFKYYDFFVGNLNAAVHTSFPLKHLLLPLGISFFTFQQLSFVIDSYRGETRGYGFVEYALFVSFFPQLVAGPIVLHAELIPQFRDEAKRRVDYQNLATGIMMFTLGLAKKVLVADVFGRCVTYGFTHTDALSATDTLFVMLSYTFQIYFDFSGYSDMAIGLGRMFNFSIPQNFNSPYQATSITGFWERWHMTLTRFLRNYIYIPLGGSRKGKETGRMWLTYRNIFIVFLVSGIWHGANWTFVLWGCLHGLLRIAEQMAGSVYEKILKPVKWLVTFFLVNVLWLLFRADSVSQWTFLLKRLFSGDGYIHEGVVEAFKVPGLVSAIYNTGAWWPERKIYAVCGAVFLMFALAVCVLCRNNYEREYRLTRRSVLWAAALLFLCLISLSTVSVFLYFNF